MVGSVAITSSFLFVVLLTIIDAIHSKKQPNVILFLADDLGYGDLASYGHPSQEFNGIDRLASEGVRFQQFYAADSMCTPARAALMTGRLPIRIGMVGGRRVLVDHNTGGLPKTEWTLPKLFKRAGYNTGMTGKWHLGINSNKSTDGTWLPDKYGFDYVGWNLPFTHLWQCDDTGYFEKQGPVSNKCFLYYGDTLREQPYKLDKLTERLVDSFDEFLTSNREKSEKNRERQPFFFYFSFPHVHASPWVSKLTEKPSKRGVFGDTLNEMAWAVDKVMTSLKENELDQDTLVLFMSDHGPHREMCSMGGSAGGLKGGKTNSYEGGFRIPCIARWPGVIPSGIVGNAVMSSLDLMPTLANIINLDAERPMLSKVKQYDGIDITDYLLGAKLTETEKELSVKRPIYFYCNRKLMAVRYGKYKVHYKTSTLMSNDTHGCPHGMPLKEWYVAQMCVDADVREHDPPLVYNLNIDPFEMYALDAEDSKIEELLETVQDVVDAHQDSLGDPEDIESAFGSFTPRVIPCCNYPDCTCENGETKRPKKKEEHKQKDKEEKKTEL